MRMRSRPRHAETGTAHPGASPRHPAPSAGSRQHAFDATAVLALQRAGGNRATTVLLADRRNQPDPRPPVTATERAEPGSVQRMVIYTDKIGEIDDVISADVAFQRAMARARPDQVGRLITLDGLRDQDPHTYAIEADEAVVVVGHGTPGAVQGHPASEIAELLGRIHNIEHAAFVYVASCDAATDRRRRPRSSVVDVTAEVLSARRHGLRVIGAPGIAVNDYSGITGDRQTYYRKATEDTAIALEALVTNVRRQHDIKASRGFTSVHQAAQHGDALIKDPEFRTFYDTFVRALSGFDTALITELLGHCEKALNASGPPAGWPEWVRGWAGALQKSHGHNMSAFLGHIQKTIRQAQAGLLRMRDHPVTSFLSQTGQGDRALRSSSGDRIEYGRIAADAEWYRHQREVLRGYGMVNDNQSLRPAHDWSASYIS